MQLISLFREVTFGLLNIASETMDTVNTKSNSKTTLLFCLLSTCVLSTTPGFGNTSFAPTIDEEFKKQKKAD